VVGAVPALRAAVASDVMSTLEVDGGVVCVRGGGATWRGCLLAPLSTCVCYEWPWRGSIPHPH